MAFAGVNANRNICVQCEKIIIIKIIIIINKYCRALRSETQVYLAGRSQDSLRNPIAS